jgi:hypothetical protein
VIPHEGTSVQHHNNTTEDPDEYEVDDLETHDYTWDADWWGRPRIMGLYRCRVCRNGFARWPSECAFRRMILGVSITLVFRMPFACSSCRLMRQDEVGFLGATRSRRFWNRVLDRFS